MASMALGFFSLVLNPRYYGPVWLNSKHTVYALCIAYINLFKPHKQPHRGFPGGSGCKESACNAGDPGSIPGLGRPPGEGKGNPLQYSCLENPMDRGA